MTTSASKFSGCPGSNKSSFWLRAGKMSLGRSTPFKRMRSPTGRLSYDPMCTPTCDEYDDAALDNVRSHKRYLSEVIRVLNCEDGWC